MTPSLFCVEKIDRMIMFSCLVEVKRHCFIFFIWFKKIKSRMDQLIYRAHRSIFLFLSSFLLFSLSYPTSTLADGSGARTLAEAKSEPRRRSRPHVRPTRGAVSGHGGSSVGSGSARGPRRILCAHPRPWFEAYSLMGCH